MKISGLLSTMLDNGYYHTMNGYIEGSKARSRHRNADLLNFQYECAWRLGQWDTLDDDAAASKKVGSAFARHRLFALDNLLGENGNEHEFDRLLKLASDEVSRDLSRLNISDSASSSVTLPLTRLRALRELKLIAELMPRIGKSRDSDQELSARVSSNLEQVRSAPIFYNPSSTLTLPIKFCHSSFNNIEMNLQKQLLYFC